MTLPANISSLTMSINKYHLILCCSLILAAILLAGCMGTPATPLPVSSEMKKFNSTAEIEQYVRDSMATDQQNGHYVTMVPTIGWTGSGGIASGGAALQRADQEKGSIAIPAPAIPGTVESLADKRAGRRGR